MFLGSSSRLFGMLSFQPLIERSHTLQFRLGSLLGLRETFRFE